MNILKLGLVLLVLSCVGGNRNKKMGKRMKRLKMELQEDIAESQNKLKIEVKETLLPSVLPDMVKTVLADLVRSGDAETILGGVYEDEMKRMKMRMLGLEIQLNQTQLRLEAVLVRCPNMEKGSEDHKTELNKTVHLNMSSNLKTSSQLPTTSSTSAEEVTTSTTSTMTSSRTTTIASSTTTPVTMAPKTTTAKPRTSFFAAATVLITLKQYNTSTKTQNESKMPFDLIESIAYDPVTDRMFWSESMPSKIRSAFLNNTDAKTLNTGIRSMGVAVDPERGLLFYADVRNETVHVVTVWGENDNVVAKLKYGEGPWCIALDTFQKLIYISHRKEIYKMAYDGGHVESIVSGIEVYGIFYDSIGDALYFSDSKTVSMMRRPASEKEREASVIGTVRDEPRDLVYLNGSVYVSYWDRTAVDRLSLDGNVENDLISFKTGPWSKTITICVGP